MQGKNDAQNSKNPSSQSKAKTPTVEDKKKDQAQNKSNQQDKF